MPQRQQNIPIRNFAGPDFKVNATDLPPGTMLRTDGVSTVPQAAVSFGPSWATAWNKSQLGANIATALAGATANKVHFVTVTLGTTVFLVAWNMTSNRPRGIWHVGGTSDPDFTSITAAAIDAPDDDIYRDHTDGLNWYGSWVQDELWLGNGTDTNLVWADAALEVLGPASLPANPQDPSQVAFPPCTSFITGSRGEVYGTGNVTLPLRVWAGQPPNVIFPLNRGLKTTDYAWVDVKVNATRITALGSIGVDLLAHCDIGAPQIISGYNGDRGGWKAVQIETVANSGAINPNCARDTKISTSYLGTNLELYRLETYKGSIVDRQPNGSKWRKLDILTDKASGEWNRDAQKPISGDDYGLIFDEKNGRTWLWMLMSARTILGNTLETFATDFDDPMGAAFSPDGTLYVADSNDGTVSTVADDGTKTPLPLTFSNPTGLAFDAAGNLYVANNGNGTVSKVTPGLVKSTFASNFDTPFGLAFNSAGLLYVSDYNDNSVSSVTTLGVVTNLGLVFANPAGLACDASDNLYVANAGNGTVSKVTPLLVKTVFASDFDEPLFVAFDESQNLYVSQYNNGTVTRLTPSASATDLGFTFANPAGIAFGPDGSFYVANNGAGTVVTIGTVGTQGLYCYDERTHAITGPWRYPDFLSFCQLRDENLNGCIVCGITREGAFLWSDLQDMGEFTHPAFTTALPAECAELTSAPTPDPGIPYVGVSADGQQFMQVLEGASLSLATPWSDWAGGAVTCTKFYNNASVAVIEFGEMDASSPALQKEWTNLRLILSRNSIMYVGVYVDAGGRLTGGYRGLMYPSVDWIAAIGGESSTVKIRIIVVRFNAQPAVLSGVNVEYLPSVTN